MSRTKEESKNNGRNLGLYNNTVREALFFVCQSKVPVFSGDIARYIRQDETRRMSNEYKIIKRLIPESNTVNRLTANTRTKRYLDIVSTSNGRLGYIENFRGFLVYLFNEHLIRKESSKDYEKESDRKLHHLRRRTVNKNIHFNQKIAKRIRSVLLNPQTVKIAPFLHYWSEFEKFGFNVIGLLLEISVELQNQLHIDSYDDTYLVRRAAERFFIALENFFFECEVYRTEKLRALKELMHNYRRLVLPLFRALIEKEKERFDFIQKEYDEVELLQEFDDMANLGTEVISLIKIGSKYLNSFPNSISVLEIVRNKRNYDDYILADSFLIAKTLLEKIRQLFSVNLGYSDVAKVLEQNSIPNTCASDILKYLGYEEKSGKWLNDDDMETGRHITYVRS